MFAIKTTKAFYTCHGCKLDKQEVTVSARNSGQNIVEWVQEIVSVAISEDHKTRSPRCKETKADIGFPIDTMYGE